jgi:voltage-gated sodium channel
MQLSEANVSSWQHPMSSENDGMKSQAMFINNLKPQKRASVELRSSVQMKNTKMFTRVGSGGFALPSWTQRARVKILDSVTHLLTADAFNYFIGCLIVLNAIWIGIQTEIGIRAAMEENKDEPTALRVVSMIFCGIFAIEILMRMYVYGLTFFYAEDWRWNIFDLTIVAVQFVDEILEYVTEDDKETQGASWYQWSFGSSWMRVLRVLRLVRIVRLARLIRLLRDLRTMLCSLVNTLGSLGWTIVLLVLILYGCSVYITQVVADHALKHPEDVAVDTPLRIYFGSLGDSILCLFQSITGGIDWRDVSNPLHTFISPWLSVFYCLFIAFNIFSLLNVITGVFVESAIQNAKEDSDLNTVSRIQEVFEELELAEGGRIVWDDFQEYLDEPKMKALFKAIDLDISEAQSLFRLLDTRDSGSIITDDFIMGCLRLKGPAKSIDIATLMSEIRRITRILKDNRNTIKNIRLALDGVCDELEGRSLHFRSDETLDDGQSPNSKAYPSDLIIEEEGSSPYSMNSDSPKAPRRPQHLKPPNDPAPTIA